MFQTYRPSGRVGVLTFPLIFVGILLAIGLAYVYQAALFWIPLIYVNFLLTFGLGFILGGIGAIAVTSGKARNIVLAALLGVGLVSLTLSAKYYFQYEGLLTDATSEFMESENVPETQRAEVRKQIAKNVTFLNHIKFRTEEGWEIGRGGNGGIPIKGVFVYLIWLIEAGILLFVTLTMTLSAASEPFSEKINAWASEAEAVMSLPISNDEMVETILAADSVDDLLEIPIPKSHQSNQFAVYTVNSVEGQELEDAYLSVELVTFSVNDKGEEQTKNDSLVKHAILSSQQRQQLLENASLLKEAISDYEAAIVEEQRVVDPTDVHIDTGDDEA